MNEFKQLPSPFNNYAITSAGDIKRIEHITSTISKPYKDGITERTAVSRKMKERVLKPCHNKVTGYQQVCLRTSGPKSQNVTKYIHELVLLAFVGPRPLGFHVDHLDNNRKNNCKDNLEYVTRNENMKRMYTRKLAKLNEEIKDEK